jgi:hypothetical protein
MVRSVPPSLVTRGRVSFWERYGDMAGTVLTVRRAPFSHGAPSYYYGARSYYYGAPYYAPSYFGRRYWW